MFNSYVVFNINYHNDYYVTTPSSWPDHFKIACYSPGLSKLKTATKKRDTLKLQINFHRKCWDRHTYKNVFLFLHKGKQYTPAQLQCNSQLDLALTFRAKATATTRYNGILQSTKELNTI